MEVGCHRQAPATLLTRKRPGTHFIGSWVSPRSGLDGYGKSRPHRNSIPDRAAHGASPHRERYPDPIDIHKSEKYSFLL